MDINFDAPPTSSRSIECDNTDCGWESHHIGFYGRQVPDQKLQRSHAEHKREGCPEQLVTGDHAA